MNTYKESKNYMSMFRNIMPGERGLEPTHWITVGVEEGREGMNEWEYGFASGYGSITPTTLKDVDEKYEGTITSLFSWVLKSKPFVTNFDAEFLDERGNDVSFPRNTIFNLTITRLDTGATTVGSVTLNRGPYNFKQISLKPDDFFTAADVGKTIPLNIALTISSSSSSGEME